MKQKLNQRVAGSMCLHGIVHVHLSTGKTALYLTFTGINYKIIMVGSVHSLNNMTFRKLDQLPSSG
jgi:hypothetical protein